MTYETTVQLSYIFGHCLTWALFNVWRQKISIHVGIILLVQVTYLAPDMPLRYKQHIATQSIMLYCYLCMFTCFWI